jgi:ribosomal protein L9
MVIAKRDSDTGFDVGLDKAGLLRDLKKQVTALEDDLRERSESVEEYRTRLEGEYAKAREAQRTAATYGARRDERVTQAAVAWDSDASSSDSARTTA